jgi:hypothetical protein
VRPTRLPISVDVLRTGLHGRFFERFGGEPADVIAAVDTGPFDAAAVISSDDCVRLGYSGSSYWLLYLKGFLHYRASGTVGRGNVYVDYFLDHYLTGPLDPGLRDALVDDGAALARVSIRFADLQRVLGARQPRAGMLRTVRILASHKAADDLLDVEDATSGLVVKARAVDGWHRMFAARLGGVPTMNGEVRLDESNWTWEP